MSIAAGLALAVPAQQILLDVTHRAVRDPVGVLGAADLDGDGDLDLVGHVGFVLNDGGGIFELGGALPFANSFQLVDLDGDGFVDRLSHSLSDVAVESGIGVGGFGPRVTLLTGNFTRPDVADLDGDSDLDLFVSDSRGNVQMLRNDGPAGVAAVPLSLSPQWRYRVGGDLDGDGDVDLLSFQSAGTVDDNFAVWFNDGTAGFTQGPVLLAWKFSDYTVMDTDLDGDLDVIGVARFGVLGVLENTGAGAFNVQTAGLAASGAFLPLDGDGDGDTDLLLGTGDFYENQGGNRFSTSGRGTDYDIAEALSGDFDGDGDVDIFAGSSLFLGNDTGDFFLATPLEPARSLASNAAFSDFDGDGLVDAVVPGPTSVTVLSNDGSGGFDLSGVAFSGNVASLGDVDGDGDLDIVEWDSQTGGTPSQTPRVWRNGGGGSFALIPGALTLAASLPIRDLVLADLDGDGDLDMVHANFGQNLILRNDGTGQFTADTGALPSEALVSHQLLPYDVDGDGDLDLLANQINSGNSTYLNDGTGQFTAVPSAIPMDMYRAADLDGDGTLDLVGRTNIWRYDAPQTFTPIALPLAAPFEVNAVDDFDLDGDVDLLVRSAGLREVFLNTGAGVFAVASDSVGPMAGLSSGEPVIVDLDGDGDRDVLFREVILWGLARHASSRLPPSTGKTLRIDLSGRPGELWILGWSTSRASLSIGGLRIGIDLASATTAGWGALDASGRGSYPVTVPLNPSLVGLTVYWQGFLSGQGATTNVEPTTVTGL